MDFYGKYVEMCNKIGKSPSAVAIEIGLSKPSVNRWKNGGSPTDATAQKIATYFGVSVAYLLGKEDEDKKEKSITMDGLSNERKALIDFALSVPEDKAELLLRVMKSIVEGE